jgi:hypothetical protein
MLIHHILFIIYAYFIINLYLYLFQVEFPTKLIQIIWILICFKLQKLDWFGVRMKKYKNLFKYLTTLSYYVGQFYNETHSVPL